MKASRMRIEDREVKHLRGKEFVLVKVGWGGLAGGSLTWELESQMRESYPELFLSGNFRERKSCKRGIVITHSVLHLINLRYFN